MLEFNRQFQLNQMERDAVEWGWIFEAGDTMFSVVNAYTKAAQYEDLAADSVHRLQRVGGSVLAMVSSACADAIIIDHTCTDLSEIPDEWIEKAKNLTIHYAHTSHGSQITSGVENLETQHSEYSFARRASSTEGLPPVEYPPALRMYDGNPPETYISPDDYWDGESGMDRTRAVAATGNYNFSYVFSYWNHYQEPRNRSNPTSIKNPPESSACYRFWIWNLRNPQKCAKLHSLLMPI